MFWPFRRKPPIARVEDPNVRAALADLEARVAAVKNAWDVHRELAIKLGGRVADIEFELAERGIEPRPPHPPAHTG